MSNLKITKSLRDNIAVKTDAFETAKTEFNDLVSQVNDAASSLEDARQEIQDALEGLKSELEEILGTLSTALDELPDEISTPDLEEVDAEIAVDLSDLETA